MLSLARGRAIAASALLLSGMLLDVPALSAPADAQTPAERIATRSYPSVFEAWNPAENLNREPDGAPVPLSTLEDPVATLARHDMAFVTWGGFGLKSPERSPLTSKFTAESIEQSLRKRAAILARNPHFVLLASVTYRTASDLHPDLPESSPWWKRDAAGRRVPASADTRYGHQFFLDLGNPAFRDLVAEQCRALVATGVFDGCMLDWWHDHSASDPLDPTGAHRLQLARMMRAAIGDDALLIGNSNGAVPTETAAYLNGIFMEGFDSRNFPDWKVAVSNLRWAAAHLKRPAITALEGWYEASRDDLPLMREVTTLSLTCSDGYVLFSAPNAPPRPDHLHDWYPFWDKRLGRPTGPAGRPGPGGSFRREFEKGTVVFNPPSNGPVEVRFDETRFSEATGRSARVHQVAPGDGDIFLEVK